MFTYPIQIKAVLYWTTSLQ